MHCIQEVLLRGVGALMSPSHFINTFDCHGSWFEKLFGLVALLTTLSKTAEIYIWQPPPHGLDSWTADEECPSGKQQKAVRESTWKITRKDINNTEHALDLKHTSKRSKQRDLHEHWQIHLKLSGCLWRINGIASYKPAAILKLFQASSTHFSWLCATTILWGLSLGVWVFLRICISRMALRWYFTPVKIIRNLISVLVRLIYFSSDLMLGLMDVLIIIFSSRLAGLFLYSHWPRISQPKTKHWIYYQYSYKHIGVIWFW